ncbi:MAG: hypothetical protein ACXADF_18610, partial [Candidatus Thorarchaeota archaeon]
MNIYISPPPIEYHEDGRGSGGIWRVISAQGKWLPSYGINIVDNPVDADIVHVHAGMLIDTDKPIVHECH